MFLRWLMRGSGRVPVSLDLALKFEGWPVWLGHFALDNDGLHISVISRSEERHNDNDDKDDYNDDYNDDYDNHDNDNDAKARQMDCICLELELLKDCKRGMRGTDGIPLFATRTLMSIISSLAPFRFTVLF